MLLALGDQARRSVAGEPGLSRAHSDPRQQPRCSFQGTRPRTSTGEFTLPSSAWLSRQQPRKRRPISPNRGYDKMSLIVTLANISCTASTLAGTPSNAEPSRRPHGRRASCQKKEAGGTVKRKKEQPFLPSSRSLPQGDSFHRASCLFLPDEKRGNSEFQGDRGRFGFSSVTIKRCSRHDPEKVHGRTGQARAHHLSPRLRRTRESALWCLSPSWLSGPS